MPPFHQPSSTFELCTRTESLLPCLGHTFSHLLHPHGRACFSFSISPSGRCVLVVILHTLFRSSGLHPCVAHFPSLASGHGLSRTLMWARTLHGRGDGSRGGVLKRVLDLVPANVGSPFPGTPPSTPASYPVAQQGRRQRYETPAATITACNAGP